MLYTRPELHLFECVYHLDREHPETRLQLDIEGRGKDQIKQELHETLSHVDHEVLEE